jgi:hypothetical protein
MITAAARRFVGGNEFAVHLKTLATFACDDGFSGSSVMGSEERKILTRTDTCFAPSSAYAVAKETDCTCKRSPH